MSSWDRVRVQSPNAARALVAGVVATLVLTGLMYLGNAVGVDIWNIPAMIGAAMTFNKNITTNNAMWVWGIVLYGIFGVFMFPLCYTYWVYSWLRGAPWMRGLAWGLFLWFLVQMLVMPLIGQGVFARNSAAPWVEIISMLVLWLAYGAVFGLLAGPQELWIPREHPPAPGEAPRRPQRA